MDLIDWPGLARNALWILGLSIALAAWGNASWWASDHHRRLRRALDRPAFVVPFAIGLLLFAASMGWGANRWWERLIWALLALWCLVDLVAGVGAASKSCGREKQKSSTSHRD